LNEKLSIEDALLEESCRQWCDFIDEAPERRTGKGFAAFHRELSEMLRHDNDFLSGFMTTEQLTAADGLPELCFSVLPGSGDLIIIVRGEMGYYHSDWNTSDRERNLVSRLPTAAVQTNKQTANENFPKSLAGDDF